MHPYNQIRNGFIILTLPKDNGSNYIVAINPSDISAIESESEWGGCNAKVYIKGLKYAYHTAETLDEILSIIGEFNKQHTTHDYE